MEKLYRASRKAIVSFFPSTLHVVSASTVIVATLKLVSR